MRRRLSLLAALAALAAAPGAADEASGDWTGALELRGNYYWETSTRVVAPSLDVGLEAPNGTRFGVEYLVDAITSASQAAGALTDNRFTEIRHQGSGRVSHELELRSGQFLTLGGGFYASREPDYRSGGVSLLGALSTADRQTTLGFNASFLHDEVRQLFRTGSRVSPNPMGGTDANRFAENFDAMTLAGTVEHILTPQLYVQAGYQYAYLNGFLANPYRRVPLGDVTAREGTVTEVHPGVRRRHTLHARLAYYIRATGTSLHLAMRGYADSWDVRAVTPEVRLYQELGEDALVRLRYRHYNQSAAFFYQDVYVPTDVDDGDVATFDPKMSNFHSHLAGFQLRLRGGFLAGTVLDGLRDATLDFNLSYIWNTNRFGNGVIGSAGLTVPF
ncbi:MAG: DUF3570 domain-containing protein [Myxococcota bacterium]